jgi:dipeptidyl aminopeptidase/acylaminoacyl peptidase
MIKDLYLIQVDGVSLVGQLFLPDLAAKYPLVCLCHGVPSGNPPDPDDGGYPELAERLCRHGLAVFWFNFRGTGESGGNLDLAGWARDLQAVLNYLWEQDNFDKARLSLVGFSAGAAVSIFVAAGDSRVSGVIACCCPAEIVFSNQDNNWQAVIDRFRAIGVFRDRSFPPSVEEWAANCQSINPINYIDKIAPRPLLLIHGSDDQVVPLEHAQRLYEKAGVPKRLIVIDGAGHRLRRDNRVIEALLKWLNASPGPTGN